jgi:peptide/nickel transport system ATP-binding protein
MYAGKVVEEADVDAIFYEPSHPYTKGLLSSVPKTTGKRKRLDVIEGIVPNPANMPKGCRFHPRCKNCMAICLEREPPLAATADGRKVACWLFPAGEAEE